MHEDKVTREIDEFIANITVEDDVEVAFPNHEEASSEEFTAEVAEGFKLMEARINHACSQMELGKEWKTDNYDRPIKELRKRYPKGETIPTAAYKDCLIDMMMSLQFVEELCDWEQSRESADRAVENVGSLNELTSNAKPY